MTDSAFDEATRKNASIAIAKARANRPDRTWRLLIDRSEDVPSVRDMIMREHNAADVSDESNVKVSVIGEWTLILEVGK